MNRNRRSYLDGIWEIGGTYRLKRHFDELAKGDRQEALRIFNDDKVGFPVLFILMEEISAHHMYHGLSQRNRTAINICTKKIYKYEMDDAQTDTVDEDTLYQTLKWILATGKDWGGPSEGHDPYDSVIDYTVAQLIVMFEDKTALKDIVDLIFRRNRQGLFIHDLVWSFFQTLDRDALAKIAGYILSANPRDVELACRLLGLEELAESSREAAKNTHRKFLAWLDENRPYLYVTGEHFQMTSQPKHLDTDREAKYLGKEISPRYRAPIAPLSETEIGCLNRYRGANEEEQALLTDFSHRLRHRNTQQWHEWLLKQTAEQVLAARTTYEVV